MPRVTVCVGWLPRVTALAVLTWGLSVPAQSAAQLNCYSCTSSCTPGGGCDPTHCGNTSEGGCDCIIRVRRVGPTEVTTCVTTGLCSSSQASICPGDRNPPPVKPEREAEALVFPMYTYHKMIDTLLDQQPLLGAALDMIERNYTWTTGRYSGQYNSQTGIRPDGSKRYGPPQSAVVEIVVRGQDAEVTLDLDTPNGHLRAVGAVYSRGEGGRFDLEFPRAERLETVSW